MKVSTGKIKKSHKIYPEGLSKPLRQRFWPKNKKPFDHQRESIEFVINRPICYLALDPGLGKTIIAAIVYNRMNAKAPTKCFYICPSFLVSDVEDKFNEWCPKKNLYIIKDSSFTDPDKIKEVRRKFEKWPGKKLLVIDEAHRFKSEKTIRSANIYKIAKQFKRVIFMSGTPMPNKRPIELWPILWRFAPEIFGGNPKRDFFPFAKRFCGAYKTEYGWRFDGISNEALFKKKLKPFMLEISDEVLNLPPKLECLLTVGDDIPPLVSKLEKKILNYFTEDDLLYPKISKLKNKPELHFQEYLKHLGEYKLKYACPYIEDVLMNTQDNIIIFAEHKIVIERLSRLLKNFRPFIIDGDTPSKKRKTIVDEYQADKKRRLFIINYKAGGLGLTITKANRAIFVEFPWTPGEVKQAIGRLRRIGQKKSVLIQYVVLKNSFDKRRMEMLLNKAA